MKLFAGGAVLLILAIFNFVGARVVRVPQDVATIQLALDSIEDNDTILVRSGTYTEVLTAPARTFYLIGSVSNDSLSSPATTVDVSQLELHDTTAVFTLSPRSIAIVENIRFRNRWRNGIRSWADSLVVRNCVLDSMHTGVHVVEDSLPTAIRLENTKIRNSAFQCLDGFGNTITQARRCEFSGTGDDLYRLVAVVDASFDLCRFSSLSPTVLAVTSNGSVSIRNSHFGPAVTRTYQSTFNVHATSFKFTGNTVSDCSYGTHVLDINIVHGDSVEISDNIFERCIGQSGLLTATGVVQVALSNEITYGPVIENNQFSECSGNRSADDLALTPFYPAFINNNVFSHDSLNGIPSIVMSENFSQPTPAVYRDNYFVNCGYAMNGGHSADARFNDWGDPSGPFHEFDNPQGLGDTITGFAQFIPWLTDTTSDAHETPSQIADEFSLTAFPNPLNPTTQLSFTLSHATFARLSVYDLLGREKVLMLSERLTAGTHSVQFDGNGFATGVYFARLQTETNTTVTKLVMLK